MITVVLTEDQCELLRTLVAGEASDAERLERGALWIARQQSSRLSLEEKSSYEEKAKEWHEKAALARSTFDALISPDFNIESIPF